MPSPFPRMDPYLEGSLWTTFHFSLAAEIVRQLAPRVLAIDYTRPPEVSLDEPEARWTAENLGL